MTRPPKSPADTRADLGRRERQIVDAVYRLGRASVADVRANIDDPPSYSAVRGMLNLLEEKGHLRHEVDGLRYIYLPVVAATHARYAASHMTGGASATARGSRIRRGLTRKRVLTRKIGTRGANRRRSSSPNRGD